MQTGLQALAIESKGVRKMAIELFNNGNHLCIMFDDLVNDENNNAVQANQFLIVDNDHGALIDPGGNMTYNGLLLGMGNPSCRSTGEPLKAKKW